MHPQFSAPHEGRHGAAPRPALPPFIIRPARMGDVQTVGRLLAASCARLPPAGCSEADLAAAQPLITRPRAALLSCGTY